MTRLDSPPALRSRLRLRAHLLAFADAAGIVVPASDPDLTCDGQNHPGEASRYDGLFLGFEPLRAAMTCMSCGSSYTVAVRSDVAEAHGGPRGPEGSEEVMTSKMARR